MKLFFHNYQTRKGITSENPQTATVSQALEIFSTLNSETENFFGIIDDSEKTIQFVLEAEDKWLVDIPNLPDFINDQQFADNKNCLEIISKIFDANKIVIFPEMRKVDIMNETLDEKLAE